MSNNSKKQRKKHIFSSSLWLNMFFPFILFRHDVSNDFEINIEVYSLVCIGLCQEDM